MTTEYRRGIPSHVRIEAAERLGLLWARQDHNCVCLFAVREGEVFSDFGPKPKSSQLSPLLGAERVSAYRPIRPDGTPVDWETLDAEVARVGQQGQPQGFRAVSAAEPPPGVSPLREQSAAAPTQPTAPEPRRFADVRPDRHGWRWWRTSGSSLWGDNIRTEIHNEQFRVYLENVWQSWVRFALQHWLPDRTVIPTDEQGNPVSWESIGQPVGQVSGSLGGVAGAAVAALPDTPHTRAVVEAHRQHEEEETRAHVIAQPLPRFTADELDDVDHSKSTRHDHVVLRGGKLTTAEQIAKYRKVRARRINGTVADALKESRIDCEVAQYVLERWMGGLGDSDATRLYQAVVSTQPHTQGEVDQAAQNFLLTHASALDTSEQPDSATQRERQESEARRQRLAELRLRLTAERLAQTDEVPAITSRFDLIEPDPQADPAASIRAWEARQAAVKSQSRPSPCPTAAMPETRPRVAPAIDVVDAEADGLSRGDVVLALLGRAMNRAC